MSEEVTEPGWYWARMKAAYGIPGRDEVIRVLPRSSLPLSAQRALRAGFRTRYYLNQFELGDKIERSTSAGL